MNHFLDGPIKTSDAVDYHYLDQSGVVEVDGINDEKDYNVLRRCFTTLGFDEGATVMPILSCVAAVLHLGNVQFGVVKKAMEEDSSEVANQDVLELACKLLGVDKTVCNTNLISKNIGNRSTMMVAYSVEKAQEARDGLVKFLYGNLFQLIIDAINKSLAKSQTSAEHASIIESIHSPIGLLHPRRSSRRSRRRASWRWTWTS